MGNMLSCTVSFFGALPSGHQEQGSRFTVLVRLCTLQSTHLSREVITSMQHCKLEDVICGMQLSAEMDGQTREVYCVMFFFIRFVGMLHRSDVMFLIVSPNVELNCTA